MKRALGAKLRTLELHYVRSLSRRIERSDPGGRAPPAILARWLERREDRLFAALGGAMSFELLRTAYAVGLFGLLHDRPGLRAAEIARALGLKEYPTRI